jgi:hypothetical protein
MSRQPTTIEAALKDLRRSAKRSIDIPLIALAIWTQRGDQFEDGDDLGVVSDRFRSEYHITDAEASAFFSDDVEAPEPFLATNLFDPML